ncbi:MAG: hypothetical protein SFY68_10605 [Candidatus Sumerlaeia bacterium]|nr:hypothetical protein [Candidatus Sumerlaeia bacterium]
MPAFCFLAVGFPGCVSYREGAPWPTYNGKSSSFTEFEGSVVHEETGFVFPRALGSHKLERVTQYDDDGYDVEGFYQRSELGITTTLSVRVMPGFSESILGDAGEYREKQLSAFEDSQRQLVARLQSEHRGISIIRENTVLGKDDEPHRVWMQFERRARKVEQETFTMVVVMIFKKNWLHTFCYTRPGLDADVSEREAQQLLARFDL